MILAPVGNVVARLLLTLSAIIVVLLAAAFLRQQWKSFAELERDLSVLRQIEQRVDAHRSAQLDQLGLNGVPGAAWPVGKVEALARDLENRKRVTQGRIADLCKGILTECDLPLSADFRQAVELKIELEIVSQLGAYAGGLAIYLQGPATLVSVIKRLLVDRQATSNALNANRHDQWLLSKSHPLTWQIPFTDAYATMRALERKEIELKKSLGDLDLQIAQKQADLGRLQSRLPYPRFLGIDEAPLLALSRPLRDRIEHLSREIDASLLRRVARQILNVAPQAAGILAAAIVGSLALQLLRWFIAPLASRFKGVRLVPSDRGDVQGPDVPRSGIPVASKIVISVRLERDEEIIVRPRCVRSIPEGTVQSTTWLVDPMHALASLGSGLFAATRIKALGPTEIHLDSEGQAMECAVVDVADGSAMIVNPMALVGLVHRAGTRVKLERRWTLGSLKSWLTFHFRHLIVHGPIRLIVHGHRGVVFQRVEGSVTVRSGSVLAVSAGLTMTVRRTETLTAYLRGARPLYTEGWKGPGGWCLTAAAPSAHQKQGLPGRLFGGVLDAILNVFGL